MVETVVNIILGDVIIMFSLEIIKGIIKRGGSGHIKDFGYNSEENVVPDMAI